MKRTICLIIPDMTAWGNFRKVCKEKGWKYQTLANTHRLPKIGKPAEIDGITVHRVEVN